jgi:hypothetical protein
MNSLIIRNAIATTAANRKKCARTSLNWGGNAKTIVFSCKTEMKLNCNIAVFMLCGRMM